MSNVKTDSKSCIMCTTGAYLVLAGPGTGKTYTVIHRIENLVKNEGVEPSSILCLTFSNAAAKEMLDRLKRDVGIEGVNIFTFHGLCLDVIAKNREKFGLGENYSLINDALKNDIMRSCLKEREPQYWKTSTGNDFHYIGELISSVSDIKRNRLSKERYLENIKENPDFQSALVDAKATYDAKQTKKAQNEVNTVEMRIGRAVEAWTYFEMYSSRMQEHNLIDFDDCISLVLDKMDEDPEFTKELASNYRFIMVDEYQDTNVSQNELVIKLGRLIGNVFAVGDDDQMIYRFQGADIGSINNYRAAFASSLTTYCLQNNYRSNQNILDIAEIMAEEAAGSRVVNDPSFKKEGISKRLTAKNGGLPNNNVSINVFSNALEERKAVVHDIAALIESDNCPRDKNGNKTLNEIAILVRTNGEASKYSQLLSSIGIDYEIKKGVDLFEVDGVNLLLCYLQALSNPKRYAGSLLYLLHSKPFCLCPEDFYYVWERNRHGGSEINIIDILENGIRADAIKEKDKVERILKAFRTLSAMKQELVSLLLDEAGERSGIFDYYSSLGDWDSTQAGFELLRSIATGFISFYGKQDLNSFLNYIQGFRDNGVSLPVEKPKTGATANAVQVITYHASKGREFSYVFMPNLTNKVYEDKKDKQTKLPLTEYGDGGREGRKIAERIDNVKLLFVGMTRARHTLNLSYSLKTENDKDTDITELLNHIKDEDGKGKVEIHDRTGESYPDVSRNERNPVKELFDWDGDYNGLVMKYLEEIKNYSATNLNSYLSCPAKYYLERVIGLQNQGDSVASGYGSAVHKACDFLVKKALEDKVYPSYGLFEEVYRDEVDARFHDEDQKRDLFDKGEKALPQFYKYLSSIPVARLYAAEKEYEPMFEGKPFIAKIDRMETDGKGSYQIYDYKTGKPKDGRKICWGGPHEDYFRQLGMYCYVLGKKGLNVNGTGFIFPDATDPSDYGFSLRYSQSDIDRIVADYKEAIQDINDMKFNQCESGSRTCGYCPFRTTVCKR